MQVAEVDSAAASGLILAAEAAVTEARSDESTVAALPVVETAQQDAASATAETVPVEQVRVEPVQTETVQTEPLQTEHQSSEPTPMTQGLEQKAQDEQRDQHQRHEDSRQDESRLEAQRSEEPGREESKAEESRVEEPRVEEPKGEDEGIAGTDLKPRFYEHLEKFAGRQQVFVVDNTEPPENFRAKAQQFTHNPEIPRYGLFPHIEKTE